MTGYEALRGQAAWREWNERGRILAAGEDSARLLHAMTTNHIQGLAAGQGCFCFFLNAQGRIQADASILRVSETDFLVSTEPNTKDMLWAHLDKYIIADDVALTDLGPTHFEIAIEGPQATAVAERFGIPLPAEPYGIVPALGGYVANLSATGLPGVRLVLPIEQRAGVLAELAEIPTVDEEAWETVRLEQGKPRFGVEILEKHLVQETRVLSAVHFSKGCYLGQEIVERVRARGAVHKGLASIRIDTEAPPAVDAEIQSAGVKVGQVLSARFSPGEGKVVGFAMLGVDYLKGERELDCAGARVSV